MNLGGSTGPGPSKTRPVSAAVHDIQVREAAPSFGFDAANNNKNMFQSTLQQRDAVTSNYAKLNDGQAARYGTNNVGMDLHQIDENEYNQSDSDESSDLGEELFRDIEVFTDSDEGD